MFISWDTVLGVLAGVGLIAFAIHEATDNVFIFASLHALAMVIGGTFASTMVSYQGRYVMKTVKAMFAILFPTKVSPQTLFAEVGQIIEWAKEVRQKGPAVLDEKLESGEKLDDFARYGLGLLTSGYKGEELRELLTDFTDTMYDRAQVQVGVLKNMGAYAPAFGMIATLVGLIIMLDQMGSDVSGMGKGISLALVGTLYGAVAANMLFKPAALKTDQKNNLARFRHNLLVEGFVMLSMKADPVKIQDKLNSYLEPQYHFDLLSDGIKSDTGSKKK